MPVKIDQALVDTFIDAGFGLAIAHENLPYSPVIGTPYAELIVLQNDTTMFSLHHSNQTDGVFRVILKYPVDSGSIAVKQKADAIFEVYKIGRKLTYDGVSLTIVNHSRRNGVAENGWYSVVLTIAYRAFIKR
jgi:hypothetical protein